MKVPLVHLRDLPSSKKISEMMFVVEVRLLFPPPKWGRLLEKTFPGEDLHLLKDGAVSKVRHRYPKPYCLSAA